MQLFSAAQLQHVDDGVADFIVAAVEAASTRGHGVDAGDGFLNDSVETFFFDFVGPVEAVFLANTGSAQGAGTVAGNTVLAIQLRPVTRLRSIRSGRSAIVGTGCQPQGRQQNSQRSQQGYWLCSTIYPTAALISSSEQSMHIPLGGMALKPSIACLTRVALPLAIREPQAAESPVFGAPAAPVV